MKEVVAPGVELGLAELAAARWGSERAAPSGARPGAGRDAGGLGGPELGGVVARRRRHRSSRPGSAPTPCTAAAGTGPRPPGWPRGGRWDALDFRGETAVAARLAPARPPAPRRPASRGRTWPGSLFHDGLSRPRRPATRRRPASSPRGLHPSAGGDGDARSGDARPGAGGRRRSWPARRWGMPACAASTRPRRPRWRARPRSRSPAPGRAASWSLRAPRCAIWERASAWCSSASRRSPTATAAATCSAFCRGPSTAPWRRGVGAGRAPRSVLTAAHEDYRALAAGLGPPHRWPRWPSCGAGRGAPRDALALLDGGRALERGAALCRARLALDAGDGRARRGARRAAGCVCIPPRAAGSTASAGRRGARRGPRWARGELDEARLAVDALREVAALGRTRRRCARRPTWRRACSRPAGGAARAGPDAAGGRRGRASRACGAPYETAGARLQLGAMGR